MQMCEIRHALQARDSGMFLAGGSKRGARGGRECLTGKP